jgi:hypothetical protein
VSEGSAEDCLSRLRPEWGGASLLEVLASVYGKEDWGADTAVWLDVLREEALSVGGNGRFSWLAGPSPAWETMAALDEVVETTEGLVIYPDRLDAEEQLRNRW